MRLVVNSVGFAYAWRWVGLLGPALLPYRVRLTFVDYTQDILEAKFLLRRCLAKKDALMALRQQVMLDMSHAANGRELVCGSRKLADDLQQVLDLTCESPGILEIKGLYERAAELVVECGALLTFSRGVTCLGGLAKNADDTDDDCALCLCPMESNDPIRPCSRLLACGHAFHLGCLRLCLNSGDMRWPMCRCDLSE